RLYLLRALLLLAATFGILAGIDRIILPKLEDLYLFDGPAWRLYDKRVTQSSEAKILFNNRLQMWHSRLMPLPATSSKRRRILVLGDSFVWGDGYANINDAW